VNAKEETTPPPRIKEQHRINWNLINIVGFAGNTPYIRKPNKKGKENALYGII
jgi:hypothetical protein